MQKSSDQEMCRVPAANITLEVRCDNFQLHALVTTHYDIECKTTVSLVTQLPLGGDCSTFTVSPALRDQVVNKIAHIAQVYLRDQVIQSRDARRG